MIEKNYQETLTFVIVGASRGIGAAVAQHFSHKGYRLFSVCRTSPVVGEWIQADISTPQGITKIANTIGNQKIDALLYMGGVWEKEAFTDKYNFMNSSDDETRFIINVNTIAPIEIVRKLVHNLAKANNPRAIFIGSLSGFDNCATPEVANTASKFGLRGAIQSLRLALKDQKIGFTVINPENVATEEVISDIAEGRFSLQTPIPLTDIIRSIEWILNLSSDVDVQDLNLLQKNR